ELDPAARLLLHLLHPRLVHRQPDVGLRRHEGVELERDRLLGEARERGHTEGRGGGALQERTAFHRGVLRKRKAKKPIREGTGNSPRSRSRFSLTTGHAEPSTGFAPRTRAAASATSATMRSAPSVSTARPSL